jgi:hypothetical protein
MALGMNFTPFDRYVTVLKERISLMFSKELFLLQKVVPVLRTGVYPQKEALLMHIYVYTYTRAHTSYHSTVLGWKGVTYAI